jgi:hypothetical protein
MENRSADPQGFIQTARMPSDAERMNSFQKQKRSWWGDISSINTELIFGI